MYLRVENLLVIILLWYLLAIILLFNSKPLVNYSFVTTDVIRGVMQESAMNTGRRIVYIRHTLLSYRRSANELKYTCIESLADCGLLRYRGSRGRHATRARLAARPARQSRHKQAASAEVPVP